MTDDEKVAQRYRELGAEEPPRALDDAILAASRRGRQRWYAPLATAAVLVLAVAVTLSMQLERPGIESPAPPPASPAGQSLPAQELKLKAEVQLRSAAKKPEKQVTPLRRKEEDQLASALPAAPAARVPQPFATDRAAESSVTGSLAQQMEERTSRDAEAAARAPRMGAIQSQAKRAERAEADLQAQNRADAPERELERIAQLRVQGRHDEADKALAEFRKRYPEYRIPEEVRVRIERR